MFHAGAAPENTRYDLFPVAGITFLGPAGVVGPVLAGDGWLAFQAQVDDLPTTDADHGIASAVRSRRFAWLT